MTPQSLIYNALKIHYFIIESVSYLPAKNKIKIGLNPWQCLFHASEGPRKKYREAITPFF